MQFLRIGISSVEQMTAMPLMNVAIISRQDNYGIFRYKIGTSWLNLIAVYLEATLTKPVENLIGPD